MFFGRIANFVNQELWGAPTDVPWAVRFVEATPYGATLGPPRHPSQLYEAGLEGLVLFVILCAMFWRTAGPTRKVCIRAAMSVSVTGGFQSSIFSTASSPC